MKELWSIHGQQLDHALKLVKMFISVVELELEVFSNPFSGGVIGSLSRTPGSPCLRLRGHGRNDGERRGADNAPHAGRTPKGGTLSCSLQVARSSRKCWSGPGCPRGGAIFRVAEKGRALVATRAGPGLAGGARNAAYGFRNLSTWGGPVR